MRRIFKRVVIESPFGAPTKEGQEENIRYLRACMRDCLDRGEAPFASHGLYTQDGVLNDWDPHEREKGIQAGFEWRAVAQATIVYSDRGITAGMRAGIHKASQLQEGGVFDHYVEYRLLGGEWSSLGGPEEIRKHLEGLLTDHAGKHRHLALVPGSDLKEKRVQPMPTPAELSMGAAMVVKLDERPFERSEAPNGPIAQMYKAAKASIPPWVPDPDQKQKDREWAESFQQQPPALPVTQEEWDQQEHEARERARRPRTYQEVHEALKGGVVAALEEACDPGAGVPARSYTREVAKAKTKAEASPWISKKTRACPHGRYPSLCPEPECKDLLKPESMSEGTKALFGGEFGESEPVRGKTALTTFLDDEQPYVESEAGPRGRMQDGKVLKPMTLDEIKDALKQGGQERAEAEKRRPKR